MYHIIDVSLMFNKPHIGHENDKYGLKFHVKEWTYINYVSYMTCQIIVDDHISSILNKRGYVPW